MGEDLHSHQNSFRNAELEDLHCQEELITDDVKLKSTLTFECFHQ